MAEAQEHLRTWRRVNLIDEPTYNRILQYESEREPESRAGSVSMERPSVVEAVLYLGFIVVGAGVFFLVGNNWEQMEGWAQLLLIGTAAALALAAGAGMHFASHPGVRRGGQAAWFLAVPLFAATLLVAFDQYGGHQLDDERWQIVTVATATFALALALWSVSPATLQLLAVAGSTVFFAEALGAWPDEYSVQLAGLMITAVGATFLALTELDIVRPRYSARALSALLFGLGAFHAGVDSALAWEFLAFIAGGVLIALGVWRASFVYIAAAVLTLLVALITFMFEHFSGDAAAPIALILSGGLIIASVVILIQVRSIIHRHPETS
ncbi:MAG: DUF2157 domain-containing protein [Dehalococcoidia bacterium]